LKCAILSSRSMLVNYYGEYPWFSTHPADVFGEPSSRSPCSMQDPAGFSWRVERWLIPLTGPAASRQAPRGSHIGLHEPARRNSGKNLATT
jgi:hypothetical protein